MKCPHRAQRAKRFHPKPELFPVGAVRSAIGAVLGDALESEEE
jgi:hypothetical protein